MSYKITCAYNSTVKTCFDSNNNNNDKKINNFIAPKPSNESKTNHMKENIAYCVYQFFLTVVLYSEVVVKLKLSL